MRDKSVILVVDDQPQNIELLEAYLIPQGYDVISAASGDEALAILSNNDIDLILLDVMMPVMNGFELTQRVRQDDSYQHLPIILVTALQEPEDRIKGIDAGCDDFISKPIDRNELSARIRSLLKVKAYNDLKMNYQKKLEFEVLLRTEEIKKALDSVKAASLETIHRLSVASEYKDAGTGGHIQRMSLYAAALARQIGLDEKTTELILYAAPMHDLGKIGIPDKILLKPGKLDEAEWEIMKMHPVIGAEILKGSTAEIIQFGETIARFHHEKWDGSGYPHCLKGEEIPLICRIVAVADVFDALTSARPYKEAFSVEKAIAIIKEGNGSHFEPKLAEALLTIMDEILMIKNHIVYEDHQIYNLQSVKVHNCNL
jgi:putative two-component system response regulator